MRHILTFLLMTLFLAAGAQVNSISPNQAYQGQSLSTTITSTSLFLTSSSPQGNIQNIILKNASDSAFAVSDSTNVVNTSTATTFWNLPANLVTGLYNLVVRVYDSFFSGPTTDYTLSNAFTVTAATATVSGTVYNDLNHNGVMDAGEPGIPGYTIHISPVGNIAVSDANGNYTLATVPGLDTITIQQAADDIYLPAEPTSYILNVPYGATTGENFGLVLYRYLSAVSPDSGSVNSTVTVSITSSDVFKKASINNVALRNTANGNLIYGYSFSASDSNHATGSFNLYGNPQTGLYDLVVVVNDTPSNTLRTFILDSVFTVYGPIGFISGYVFADSNSNGVKDPGEHGIAGYYVDISSNTYYNSVTTDSSGYYDFYTLPNGVYTVTVYNPYGYYGCGGGAVYTTVTSYTITINRDTVDNENFGVAGNAANDFDLFIHPGWRPASPGFVRHYWIFWGNYNLNVPVTNAVITMQYDPTLIFDSSDVVPTTNDPGTQTLTWNIGAVTSSWTGGWNGFNLYFTVPVTDTAGQLLSSYFIITPTTGDCDPSNNSVTDVSPITSSRDPNSKISVPYGGLYTGEDSIVTYTINFQNTGTASTHFVIVKDTLDPNLDPKSVIASGGSGPFTLNNSNGILTFTFNPLVLTDSATDAAHSIGFVSFMVKVKTGTPVGTVIHNTGYVYFDYNSAVITNTVTNQVDFPLGIRNAKGTMNVSVRPNPFDESTTVAFTNPAHDRFTLTLYDVTGAEVRTMSGNDAQFLIQKNGLAPGVYMYKLVDQNTRLSTQGKISVL